MKRVLILVFAVIMILCLAACGNKNDKNDMVQTPGTPTVTVAGTPTPPGTPGNTQPSPDITGNGTTNNNNTNGNMTQDNMTFTGSVSTVDGRTIVVTVDEGQDIDISGDKISVTLDRDHNFVVGDKVRVTYEGDIMEGDPVRANATKVEEID